jgi:preprotein translocase subunit SecG
MEVAILIVHVLLAVALIGFIMIQQGKGADAGASFGGGGASQTVFGSSGSGNFLSRTTAILATGLFVTSFALAVYAKQQASSVSDAGIPIVEQVEQQSLPEFEEAAAPTDSDVPVAE